MSEALVQYLPVPTVERAGERYTLSNDRPKSIGKVRGFYGNFGMLVRALAYIRSLGRDGLRAMAEGAVLNANYLRKGLEQHYHLAYDGPRLHEVVFDDTLQAAAGIGTSGNALDLAVQNLVTITTNSDQYLAELDDLASLDLNAGAGKIRLTAGGAVQDTDNTIDVRAADFNLQATTGTRALRWVWQADARDSWAAQRGLSLLSLRGIA